jgi:hypothetical protein
MKHEFVGMRRYRTMFVSWFCVVFFFRLNIGEPLSDSDVKKKVVDPLEVTRSNQSKDKKKIGRKKTKNVREPLEWNAERLSGVCVCAWQVLHELRGPCCANRSCARCRIICVDVHRFSHPWPRELRRL